MEEFKSITSPLKWLALACTHDSSYGRVFVSHGKAYATNGFSFHKCETSLKDGFYDQFNFEPEHYAAECRYPSKKIDELESQDGESIELDIDKYLYEDLEVWKINNNYYNMFMVRDAVNGMKLFKLKTCDLPHPGLLLGEHELGVFGVMPFDPNTVNKDKLVPLN